MEMEPWKTCRYWATGNAWGVEQRIGKPFVAVFGKRRMLTVS